MKFLIKSLKRIFDRMIDSSTAESKSMFGNTNSRAAGSDPFSPSRTSGPQVSTVLITNCTCLKSGTNEEMFTDADQLVGFLP